MSAYPSQVVKCVLLIFWQIPEYLHQPLNAIRGLRDIECLPRLFVVGVRCAAEVDLREDFHYHATLRGDDADVVARGEIAIPAFEHLARELLILFLV